MGSPSRSTTTATLSPPSVHTQEITGGAHVQALLISPLSRAGCEGAAELIRAQPPAQQTGALTMGYWKNRSGQAIVAGGSSTGGVCNSGTWMRTYAPFHDLSGTAMQSGAYVRFQCDRGVECVGDSMNAMLKGQMLATSLDAFFSDPALGGNRISAPAPIGGVDVDVSNICSPD